MASGGKIKWRDADTQHVKQVVQAFNRKIRKVKKTDPHLAQYQPSEISYKEMLQTLKNTDRADFNRILGKYSRYLREGAELPYTTQQGVNITIWEKWEIDNTFRAINARRRAARQQAEKLASPYTGTMYTLEDVEIMPRKNTVQEITPKHWDDFVRALDLSALHSGQTYRQNLYKNNFLAAIENQLGSAGKELAERVKKISPAKLTQWYYTDPLVSIGFTYDQREAKEIVDTMMERIDRLEGRKNE